MVWDETIIETISIFYVYVCAIKVQGSVTFLYEGSMYTRYEYLLCVCRGVCKPPSIDNKSFKFFLIKHMNVMTWD